MPGAVAPVRLLLTRPRAQADDWARRMDTLGVPTASLPLIDIEPAGDAAPVEAAWALLPTLDLAMFVSPNAVEHFFDRRPAGASWPERTWAATVGPGSARALTERGVPPVRLVQPPAGSDSLDSEHLWPELVRVAGADWSGRRALLVRGDGGREWLGDRLRDAGAEVATVGVYRRACPRLSADAAALLREAMQAPERHVWLFSSSEAIGHLEALEKGTRGRPESAADDRGDDGRDDPSTSTWGPVRALATHERIAARAQALGVGHVVLVRPEAEAVAAGFRMLSGSTLESST